MGLVYGFGKGNAQAFQLRVESNTFAIPPYLTYYNYPKPPKGLTSSDLQGFWGKDNPINQFDPFFTSIPNFIIDPNWGENQKLREEYKAAYKKINQSQRKTHDILMWSLLKLL
ncbi:MAG: hypothetical protein KDK76_04625 [Chlamydiia bacterium]|nr:hypothetical protein [Chlamydiia bacterium]